MRSKLYRLNSRDFWKGLPVAFFTGFLSAAYTIFSTGQDITFRSVLWPALASLVAYLIKNFLEDENGELLGA